ncbi:hypothetical protein IT157_01130 [bacterium]|nr:hypothetical protein [bacterium]
MKRLGFSLLLILLMGIARTASAQGFVALIYYGPPESPLTTTCGGATGLPDGTVIKIYYDADDDGPDFTDPQPTVCSLPPECETGPTGSCNFNEMPINGEAAGAGPGYFYTPTGFSIPTLTPDPSGFYFRVFEADNVTTLWTSTVFHVMAGLQDVVLTSADWTCGPSGPQCTVIDETE